MTTDPSRQSAAPADTRGALHRIASSVLAIAQTRLELIGIEIAEEKERLLLSLFIGLAGMLFGLMALVTLTGLIAATFWDSYRWQALTVLTLLYAGAAGGCILKAWLRLRDTTQIFQATLAELEKDRAAFKRPQ